MANGTMLNLFHACVLPSKLIRDNGQNWNTFSGVLQLDDWTGKFNHKRNFKNVRNDNYT